MSSKLIDTGKWDLNAGQARYSPFRTVKYPSTLLYEMKLIFRVFFKILAAFALALYLAGFFDWVHFTPSYLSINSHALDYLRRASTNSSSPILPLISRRNFWGRPDLIVYQTTNIFNPSVLCLPYVPNNHAVYVSVASREQIVEETDENTKVRRQDLIGAMILDKQNRKAYYDRSRYFPKNTPLARGYSDDKMQDLVHSTQTVFPKCARESHNHWQWPWYKNMEGPENGRLVWSRLGEPLLIYLSVSPEESSLCRTLYLVDLRSVYPALDRFMAMTEQNPPIRFPHSVPLMYHGQVGFPRNWAVFTNAMDEVLIQTDLVPQRIFKLNLEDPDNLPRHDSPASDLVIMESLPDLVADENNCLALALNQTNSLYPVDLHLSSPMLEVLLCTANQINSGFCDPSDPRNRVFITLIQVAHRRGYTNDEVAYEPRIVTLSSTAPHDYLSISKPLVYRMYLALFCSNATVGISGEQSLNSVSIAIRPKRRPRAAHELSIGYLDDLLIISFGLDDRTGHFVEVELEDVLQGHQLCEDVLHGHKVPDVFVKKNVSKPKTGMRGP
jgi:hypothetical protein